MPGKPWEAIPLPPEQGAPEPEELRWFEACCHLGGLWPQPKYEYVYVYAARCRAGALAALMTRTRGSGETSTRLAPVDGAVLQRLRQLADSEGMASQNGYCHVVPGLPPQLGGRVEAEYTSGRKLYFEDNQSPVLSPAACEKLAELLQEAFAQGLSQKVSAEDISAVEYEQAQGTDRFNRMHLQESLLTCENRFGTEAGQQFYQKTRVSEDILKTIRKTAEAGALLYWEGLPQTEGFYPFGRETVSFTLKNGREITIDSRMKPPAPAANALFSIRSLMASAGQQPVGAP